MPLILSPNDPDQSKLIAPDSPRDPNGIAHSIDPSDTGDGIATKNARAIAKANWSAHLVAWRAAYAIATPEIPFTWAELNFSGGADPDYYTFDVVGGGYTAPITNLTNVLINDTAATTILTVDGTTVADGGSIVIMTGATSSIEIWSDGEIVYTPNGEYAALYSGAKVTQTFVYTSDAGNSGKITIVINGTLTLGYSLDVFDGGDFAAGVTQAGTSVVLSGDFGDLDMTIEGDNLVRTSGEIGTAKLTFGSDADRLAYTYLEAPAVDYVGFILRVMATTGQAGRIAETVADSGRYTLEVVGSNLQVTVSDGITELQLVRPMIFDEPITVATSIGTDGLLLAISGDAENEVYQTDRSFYVAPTAINLQIGGGGASIFGGELWSPSDFSQAGLVERMNALTDTMNTIPVIDEASSTNVWFRNIEDGGTKYRLATFLTSGSLVVTGAGPVEIEAVGGGGSGGGSHGGQPAGAGGAGEYVRSFADLAVATHSITIGAGAAYGGAGSSGTRGASTTMFSLAAIGGGGGVRSQLTPVPAEADGGSGGGAGPAGNDPWIGMSIAADGVGFNGGFGAGGYKSSGGGGGASQSGKRDSFNDPITGGPYDLDVGGDGGDGVTSTFSGMSLSLGGGGGGGTNREPASAGGTGVSGAGGLGGGGTGGAGSTDAAVAGTVNTGGGGGGCGQTGIATRGGAGGSGVARVRWPFEWEWSPAILFNSGEKGFFWDLSATGTLFQNAAGTTPVTTAGQSIGYITDLSGNGLHMSRSDTTKQPIYGAGNGRHWGSTDGSTDGFSVTVASTYWDANFGSGILGGSTITAGTTTTDTTSMLASLYSTEYVGAADAESTNTSISSNFGSSLVYKINGTTMTNRGDASAATNGIAAVQVASGVDLTNTTKTTMTFGDYVWLSTYSTTADWNFMLMIDRPLTVPEQALFDAWAQGKTGATAW